MRRRLFILAGSLAILALAATSPATAGGEGACPEVSCSSTYWCQQQSPWCNICDRHTAPMDPFCD